MKHSFCSACVFLLSVISAFLSYGQPASQKPYLRVVIIRHGEKPGSGDNLSCAGLNRALQLPPVLDTVIGTPGHTYVPTISTGGKSTGRVRMFQTITPFAVQKNLTINSKYQETDTTDLAKEIRTKSGSVLVVWEHHNIPGIARNLGIANVPSWPDDDFDSIWIIDFKKVSSKGNATGAVMSIEGEHISPSSACPGNP